MRILFVDTETGGLNPLKHSLLQVGLVAYEVGKGIVGTKEFTIRRDSYDVTDFAMRVNKLDLQKVKEEGFMASDAFLEFIWFIEESFGEITCKEDRPILGGHNVGFDKSFIQHHLFDAVGRDSHYWISHRTIDVMSLLWVLHIAGKIPLEACNSQGAFEYFGIENKNAHTALSDALATTKLFEILVDTVGGYDGFHLHKRNS